jgi:hypothetical protein
MDAVRLKRARFGVVANETWVVAVCGTVGGKTWVAANNDSTARRVSATCIKLLVWQAETKQQV